MANAINFIRDLWQLLYPYWRSEERRSAWLLLIANIVLTLAMVYMTVLFNQWYNLFYNTLQDKAQAEFFHQIGRFCVLAAVYIVIAVYRIYLNQMLQIRWRRWLTDSYLKDWLADRTYYRMQLKGSATDNPDQRIAEDFRLFVDDSLSLGLGFLNAAGHPGFVRRDPLVAVRTRRNPTQRRDVCCLRVYGLGGHWLRRHRDLAHPQDRQTVDSPQLQPAEIRSRLPFQPGAFPRE
jgi:ABC transporter transmembrane region 2